MHPVPSLIQPPIKIENNKISPNFTFGQTNSRFYSPMANHLPPSPTQTKSSVSTDASSECLISPQLTEEATTLVDVETPTPVPQANVPQNGLLDILMSPDKCQVRTNWLYFSKF
jgi:hypothetical protein